LDKNNIPKAFITKPEVQYVYSRQCISGEEQTVEETCLKCGYGFYLIAPPDRTLSCKYCDNNAICPGGNALIPKPGYFRSDNESEEIVECYNKQACLGGNETNPVGICAPGYAGRLCSTCEDNYYKKSWVECAECPDYHITVLAFLLRVIWLTVLVFTIAHFIQSVVLTGNGHQQVLISQIKLLINHCVILIAIDAIRYNWTATVEQGLRWQTQLSKQIARNMDF